MLPMLAYLLIAYFYFVTFALPMFYLVILFLCSFSLFWFALILKIVCFLPFPKLAVSQIKCAKNSSSRGVQKRDNYTSSPKLGGRYAHLQPWGYVK